MRRVTRLIDIGDAAALAALTTRNREFFALTTPERPDSNFTVAGQHTEIAQLLQGYADGACLPHVILDGERIVGTISLMEIVRGPWQCATLGYRTAEEDSGHGHTTAAIAEMCQIGFGQLDLHRIEAGTIASNIASQRVLERNGFARTGFAPQCLQVAGSWQDVVWFQKLRED